MQKLKIGILTFYYTNTNYGGQCQAYALQKVLSGLGYDAEQICYKTTPQYSNYASSWKDKIQRLLQDPCNVFINKFINPNIKKRTKQRIENFNKFKMSIPHSDRVYDDDTVKMTNDIYSVFICGSDQIWKDWGTNSDAEKRNYILGFVNQNRIALSYAASLGVNEISQSYQKLLCEELKKFKAISVRERSAIDLLKQLTEKEVVEVVDPVLLLSKEEWAKCAIKPEVDQNYVFCYFLGENKNLRKYARTVAKKNNWKLITIPYAAHHSFNKADWNFGEIRDMEAGPREFIGYIQNAKLILTDSFHAMVFSTIFHKNFYVFRRDSEKVKVTMNNRISDFLDTYGIKGRLITCKSQTYFEDIDYRRYDEMINKKRNLSIKYLSDNLTL